MITNKDFHWLFAPTSDGGEAFLDRSYLLGAALVLLKVDTFTSYEIASDYGDVAYKIEVYDDICPCLINEYCEPDDMRAAA